jgi:hypothetical protein
MGYTDVMEYKGGKQEWIDAGLPVESEGTPDAKGACVPEESA